MMNTNRIVTVTIAVALTIILAIALWFRVSSLGAIPEHYADESYEGLQVARMLQGQTYTWLTMNGNLLDPFFMAMQVPFHLIAKPSAGVIRAASALSGILAVLLVFGFGSKALDRKTAIIAAVLLAAMPPAIVHARTCHEYSQIPFFGVLAICFAFRANVVGLVLTLLASFLVHPINAFLVPIVFPILIVQLARKYADRPVKRRWVLGSVTIATAVAVAALGLHLASRPIVQSTVGGREPLDWGLFVKSIETFLLFQYAQPGSNPDTIHVQHWIFWGLCPLVLAFGTVGLIRKKQWDRLALLLGLIASLAAFHVVSGPKKMVNIETNRYGVVFIAPIVLAFASLIQGMLAGRGLQDESTTPSRRRSFRVAGSILVGFGLLCCLWTNMFSSFTKSGRETFSTVWTDSKDIYEQAISHALRDHFQTSGEGRSGTPAVIRGHGYWVNTPIEYLASWRKNVKVEQLFPTMEEFSRPPNTEVETWLAPKRLYIIEQLRRGEYLVGFPNQKDPWSRMIETTVATSFPADQVEKTAIKNVFNGPALMLYHLKPAALAVRPPESIVR